MFWRVTFLLSSTNLLRQLPERCTGFKHTSCCWHCLILSLPVMINWPENCSLLWLKKVSNFRYEVPILTTCWSLAQSAVSGCPFTCSSCSNSSVWRLRFVWTLIWHWEVWQWWEMRRVKNDWHATNIPKQTWILQLPNQFCRCFFCHSYNILKLIYW